jgi:hypothetical protein
MKKKSIDLRVFAGVFLSQPNTSGYPITADNYGRAEFVAGGNTGVNDYLYDYAMIGRSETDPRQNVWGRQILPRDAGVRNFAAVGKTDSWITALNFTAPFPGKIPVSFFTDLIYFNDPSRPIYSTGGIVGYTKSENKLSFIGGVALVVVKDVFEIYVPLFNSDDFETSWTVTSNPFNNIFERTSFLLNLNKLNAIKGIRELKF